MKDPTTIGEVEVWMPNHQIDSPAQQMRELEIARMSRAVDTLVLPELIKPSQLSIDGQPCTAKIVRVHTTDGSLQVRVILLDKKGKACGVLYGCNCAGCSTGNRDSNIHLHERKQEVSLLTQKLPYPSDVNGQY